MTISRTNQFAGILILHALVGVLLLGFCVGCSSTGRNSEKGINTSPVVVDWKAKFLRERDNAEANVRLARTAFPENSRNRQEAENRYARARTSINLLIEDIQASIKAGRAPDSSALYASRAHEAEATLLAFDKFVRQNGLPAEKQPKVWPLATPIITELGGLVWEKISAGIKARGEKRAAALQSAAAELNSTRFVGFSEVSKTP